MTRYVLLAGVLFAASFTLLWLMSAVVFPLSNDRTPFTGTGAAFEIWLLCLLIAVVSDAFVKIPPSGWQHSHRRKTIIQADVIFSRIG
jgi:hypothetical protein